MVVTDEEKALALLDRVAAALWSGTTITAYCKTTGEDPDPLYGRVRQLGDKSCKVRILTILAKGSAVSPDVADLEAKEYAKLKPSDPLYWRYLAKEFEAGGAVPAFARKVGQKPQTVYTQIYRAGLQIRILRRVLVNQLTGEEYIPPQCRNAP